MNSSLDTGEVLYGNKRTDQQVAADPGAGE